MPVKVKICGVTDEEAIETAIGAGADLLGFVFYAPSPRNLSLERARALAERVRGRAKKVALVVDADDDTIGAIVDAVRPDYLQAHGGELPERIAEITARFGIPVIKAIKVRNTHDIDTARRYQGAAAMILFDAKAPEDLANALPGGNGITFDWGMMSSRQQGDAFMLSGGLAPDNVAEAVRIARPAIVDVSSGVEYAPGHKDPKRIKAFMAAVRRACEGEKHR